MNRVKTNAGFASKSTKWYKRKIEFLAEKCQQTIEYDILKSKRFAYVIYLNNLLKLERHNKTKSLNSKLVFVNRK